MKDPQKMEYLFFSFSFLSLSFLCLFLFFSFFSFLAGGQAVRGGVQSQSPVDDVIALLSYSIMSGMLCSKSGKERRNTRPYSLIMSGLVHSKGRKIKAESMAGRAYYDSIYGLMNKVLLFRKTAGLMQK